MQISSVFDKSLEYFISYNGKKKWGYTIYKNQDTVEYVEQDYKISKIVKVDILNIEPFYVRVKAQKEIKGPLILHKGMELIIVIHGSICIIINDKEHILKKQDSLLLKTSSIKKLENRGKCDCEFIYILL